MSLLCLKQIDGERHRSGGYPAAADGALEKCSADPKALFGWLANFPAAAGVKRRWGDSDFISDRSHAASAWPLMVFSPLPIPLSQLSWCITIMALAYILSSHFGPRCEKSAAPSQFATSSPMVFLGRMAKDGRFSPDGAFPLGREWGVSSDAVSFARFRGRRPKFCYLGHLGIKLAKIQRQ